MSNIDSGATSCGRLSRGTRYDVRSWSDKSNNEDGNNNNEIRPSDRRSKVLHNVQEEGNEEWQLLDVNENRTQSEGHTGVHRKQEQMDDHRIMSTSVKTSSDIKEYVEVGPADLNHSQPSRALIHTCTAIYSLLPLASLLSFVFLMSLLFTRYYYVTVVYYTYIILDRKTCNRGGRRIEFIYRSRFWSFLAAYFPIKLRHSKDFRLDPKENYILAYHPHGISAFGAVTAFATSALNFDKLFPGMTARFMVHEMSFAVPVMREVFLFRGDCSVNSRSLDYILSQKTRTGKAGNLLTLVVGGLAEADLSDAEVLKIVVAKRQGFVRKALKHGCNIIPCIAFGENSVFVKVNLKQDSYLHRLENLWYNMFKFKHPIYYGRSIITNHYKGAMPFKKPITVVMGDPIEVKLNAEPSQKDVEDLHKLYLERLSNLFESNTDLCIKYDKCMELL